MIHGQHNVLRAFVADCMDLLPYKNALCPGNCDGLFGNQDLSFRMLALRVECSMNEQLCRTSS